ncbi:hypothetical protein [Cryobacterium sp. Y57]|nr:hypothetical protein [Cryobacterium sp. Y57]
MRRHLLSGHEISVTARPKWERRNAKHRAYDATAGNEFSFELH